MKKIIATALLFVAGMTSTAHASFISGTQTLTNGNTVALQGLEWMPLTYTAGLSRNYVESATGWTDRFNNSWQASDWRYATRAETAALINSLWGGVFDEWSKDNGVGALWFINTFGGLAFDTGYGTGRNDIKSNAFNWQNFDYSSFLFGAQYECDAQPDSTCLGRVAAGDNYQLSITSYNLQQAAFVQAYQANSGLLGLLGEKLGGDFSLTSDNLIEASSFGRDDMGSLLVRAVPLPPQQVPAPAVISWLGFGLCALAVARRRNIARKAQPACAGWPTGQR